LISEAELENEQSTVPDVLDLHLGLSIGPSRKDDWDLENPVTVAM
jgi:hypothetical protein